MLHRLSRGAGTVKDAQHSRSLNHRGPGVVVGGVLAALSLFGYTSSFAAQAPEPNTLGQVCRLIDSGHFKQAEAQIIKALADATRSTAEREQLAFERERMGRILLDFTLTVDEAQTRIRRQIQNLTTAEFTAWDAAGLLEHMVIDGRKLYFNRAPSNLFRLSPEALARRTQSKPAWTDGPMEQANAHHREIRHQAISSGKHNVAPRRVRVTYSISVNPD